MFDARCNTLTVLPVVCNPCCCLTPAFMQDDYSKQQSLIAQSVELDRKQAGHQKRISKLTVWIILRLVIVIPNEFFLRFCLLLMQCINMIAASRPNNYTRFIKMHILAPANLQIRKFFLDLSNLNSSILSRSFKFQFKFGRPEFLYLFLHHFCKESMQIKLN